MPYFFDVISYNTIKSDELKEHIRRYGKIILSGEKKIPKGWVETTLGEVCDVQSGGTPSTKNHNYWNGNIGWITPKDLSNYTKVFIKKGERSITKIGLGNSSAKLLPKHTILFSSRAPIGYVVIAENEITTNQGFKNLVCDEENSHYKFFYYLLKLKADHIEKLSSGSTFSEASASLMKSIEITIPQSIEEQTAIAKILTAFDDKIELLQAQNKTLETTAQTIFKEWFGKYQIGDELPDGWRVGKISEFISDSLGGDYGKESVTDNYTEKTVCIRGTDLPDMKMGVPEKAPRRFLKKSKLEKCKLINGDIVIEISGGTENQSTGRVAYINEQILNKSYLPMTCVNFCRILRPVDSDNSYFIYSLFEYLYNRKVLFNWENGTTGIKNLNLKALLKDFDLRLPKTNEKIIEFNQFVKSSFIKIQDNNSQIQTLKKTRDTLLPKLMSGQLRVDEFKENAV
ncbi:Type I restriction-modification system, specificity subunit S [uncultured Gammaproteobacteria bacterium]|nr:Type I restriction-modification system, specificity subunit S [uncultured Gammaproteobacteria bacterium]